MTDTEKKVAFLLSTSPYLDTESGSYDEAARDLVANGVTVQKWISVAEKLPKYGVPVLVADTRDGFVSMFSLEKRPNNKSFWFNGEDWWLDQEEITHWMPLPEPQKEEEG
jgi:hypothetical protein